MSEQTRCGFVGLIGRPNVGKSTLLNQFLGEKISITSPKPQTTRHRILGIDTEKSVQAIFVDTPGIHKAKKRAINRYMNRTAIESLLGLHVILFIVDVTIWTEEDDKVLENLREHDCPVLLVINKVDKVADKDTLLPLIEKLNAKYPFAAVFPISALKNKNVSQLKTFILKNLPYGAFLYDADQLTDRGIQFTICELIREKVFLTVQQELPYATAVEIEAIKDEPDLFRIAALIWVERPGQKKIIIGKNGQTLKRIGQLARHDIEALLDKKVFLQCWVKVKDAWSDDEMALKTFGYDNGN